MRRPGLWLLLVVIALASVSLACCSGRQSVEPSVVRPDVTPEIEPAVTSCPARVLEGDYQVEGEAGLHRLEGYTRVTGKVVIWRLVAANMQKLGCLREIEGGLYIQDNVALRSFTGLKSLTSVGALVIFNNRALKNLDGLSSLTSVESSVLIGQNPMLTSIDGLSGLTSASGPLDIGSNAALTNVDGLSAITSVGRWVVIRDNASLTNIDGLSSLTTVADGLRIIDNDALTSLAGLSNLTSVGGGLFILDNAALTDLDGLSALTSLGRGSGPVHGERSLHVEGNDSLTNLHGLRNVTGFSCSKLRIRSNAVMPSCEAEALDTRLRGLGWPGATDISDNNGVGTCE